MKLSSKVSNLLRLHGIVIDDFVRIKETGNKIKFILAHYQDSKVPVCIFINRDNIDILADEAVGNPGTSRLFSCITDEVDLAHMYSRSIIGPMTCETIVRQMSRSLAGIAVLSEDHNEFHMYHFDFGDESRINAVTHRVIAEHFRRVNVKIIKTNNDGSGSLPESELGDDALQLNKFIFVTVKWTDLESNDKKTIAHVCTKEHAFIIRAVTESITKKLSFDDIQRRIDRMSDVWQGMKSRVGRELDLSKTQQQLQQYDRGGENDGSQLYLWKCRALIAEYAHLQERIHQSLHYFESAYSLEDQH